MLRLLSTWHGLGGRLRRYQHERLGIITALTISTTPEAQIVRILRLHRNPQAIANHSPELKVVQVARRPESDGQMEGSGLANDRVAALTSYEASTVHPEVSASGSPKNSIANRASNIAAIADFRLDPTRCPRCKTRPWGPSGLLCLDCLIAEITRNREQPESLQIKAREKAHTKPTNKPCRSCKVSKPLDSFGRHRLTKDGHRHDCKVCVRAKCAKRACSG
jgi:hypothetical protein